MSNLTRSEKIDAILPLLNPRELKAWEYWSNSKEAPLAQSLQLKLFELFMCGNSCEAIRKLNPNLSLGQIVHARVEHEWDRQLQEHLEGLYGGIRARLTQVTLETSMTVANMLAAKNKLYQDKLLKYIQSGDESYIQDIGLGGIDGYRKLVEILQKLTGADQTRTVNVTNTHTVTQATPVIDTTVGSAESIVRMLLENGDKNG